jgi:predicted DNA-binding transcriptional regulator YafY
MARVDRIMDLHEHLRACDSTTVAQIARALRVSRRTILRDLATLRDRGVPITAETGPGGGVRLERDRGLATVHMRVDELVALWLAAQLSTSLGLFPWSKSARSGLDKAFSSLPPARARTLRQLVRRIVVGRPATPQIREQLGAPSPELLVAFEQAFAQSACLAFAYVDRHGRASHRIVEPHGLLVEAPALYLLTRDTGNGEARMFRMDRVQDARVLPQRTFVPAFEALKAQALAQRQRPNA